MAIVFDKQLGTNAANTTATTIALSTTNAVADGGFLVLGISWFDTATVTVGGGGMTWTTDAARNVAGQGNVALASARAPKGGVAAGTVLTATFSVSVVARAIAGLSVTGVEDSASPAEVSSLNNFNPSNTYAAKTVYTRSPRELIVAFAHVGGLLTATPGTDYSEAADFQETVGGETYHLIYKVVTGGPGLEIANGTWSGSGGWQVVMVTYREARGIALNAFE